MKLCLVASSLLGLVLFAHLASANVHPGVHSTKEVRALADRLDGRLSDASLRAVFGAENNSVFTRFDPAARTRLEPSLLHLFEGPAPKQSLSSASPQTAAEINASVPFTEPTGPARSFVLRAGADDRAKAVNCLAQAVYFEAGFEPENGAEAVAQVVLNRVRHPIFPHSVCGVVYQGAELKTGCQFSFACDGSLAKTPQVAAFARAHRVAERALNGYVMKEVGTATHYHTQWVVPWWSPTVSKLAQVGAHIFYRWSGALGLQGAFNMHYAGAERVSPPVIGSPDATVLAIAPDVTRTPTGAGHATFAIAANTAAPAPAIPAPTPVPVQAAPVSSAPAAPGGE